tara:strand:- start:1707 stop:2228 length:522 start_codon:yes stop_codon:yes gene_type:complete
MSGKILKIALIFFVFFCFLVLLLGLKKPNSYVPSKNIGKKISFFSSKKLFNSEIVNSNDLFNENKIYLLNIWSSWCIPCRSEHNILMQLSKNQSIEIVGLNYKDNIFNAKNFINDLGNPYSEILVDKDGTISIELGAYGVPETFIINNEKIILKKFIGPLNNESINEIQSILK